MPRRYCTTWKFRRAEILPRGTFAAENFFHAETFRPEYSPRDFFLSRLILLFQQLIASVAFPLKNKIRYLTSHTLNFHHVYCQTHEYRLRRTCSVDQSLKFRISPSDMVKETGREVFFIWNFHMKEHFIY